MAAAVLPIMLAYGEALAGTGKPLVAVGSIGSPGDLGRPDSEEDPALPAVQRVQGRPAGSQGRGAAVTGLAERGVRSSIVLIALGKGKGFVGCPGDGANLWNAVHVRDVASLFRLALEKGPPGRYWHAVGDGAHPVPPDGGGHRQPSGPARRERSHGRTHGAGILRVLANIVTQTYPASNLIIRRTLG